MQRKNNNWQTSGAKCSAASIPTIALVVLALMAPAWAASRKAPARIKIGTVPDEYMPTNAMVREPVSMRDFHFEVNQETRRARVVVDYTYPDELVYEKNDDHGGPQPTKAQLLGLKYNSSAHTILYEGHGRQTVCAHVEERTGIFGHHLVITNTGACQVTWQDAKHAEDDGWRIHRFRAIDVYFEVH